MSDTVAPEAPEHIIVCDGKYTLIMEPTNMRALRHGEPWRDLIGDGFVMALGHEISDLRIKLADATRKLAALDWLDDIYDHAALGREDVLNELADYKHMLENVPKVYCEVTGGILSKPSYDASQVLSYFNEHVQNLVEDDRKDTFGPLLDAVRELREAQRTYLRGPRTDALGKLVGDAAKKVDAELDAHDGIKSSRALNVAEAGRVLQEAAHGASKAAGWWGHNKTGLDLARVVRAPEGPLEELLGAALVAQKLCLVHSEVSESMEGERKGLMDDKLPHRPMGEVELADAVIRIADLAGAKGYDLGGAIAEKMAFNAVRPDHKAEAREKAGGKAY